MIAVMYQDGVFDLVSRNSLDRLIESRKIRRFKRSNGWAVLGIDLVRGMADVVYCGDERRGDAGLYGDGFGGMDNRFCPNN